MSQDTVMVQYFGKVQGIGFRVTCRAIAQDFEVKGWVKNEADGTVQLIATGEAEQVQSYLQAIRESRLKGYIEKEIAERNVSVGELKSFQIKY